MQYRFNIRDAKDTEILEAFCKSYGYQELIFSGETQIPNPELKKDFAERILKEIFIDPYVSAKRAAAAQTAGDNAKGDA